MERGILLGVILLTIVLMAGIVVNIVIRKQLGSGRGTPKSIIPDILQSMDLSKESLLYDLGAGDFRISIEAWKRYKCATVGYEIAPMASFFGKLSILFKLGPFAKIDVNVDSFLKADLSKPDKIYCHLSPVALYTLIDKFRSELTDSSYVYTFENPIPTISHDESFELQNGSKLFRYSKSSFVKVEEEKAAA